MSVYNIGDLVAVRRPQQRQIQSVHALGGQTFHVAGPVTEHYQSPYFPGWVFGYVMERGPDETYDILRIETWGQISGRKVGELDTFGTEIRAQAHDMVHAHWTFLGPAIASCLSNRET